MREVDRAARRMQFSRFSVERNSDLVGAAGIEPATLGLEIRCSIRLSYAPS